MFGAIASLFGSIMTFKAHEQYLRDVDAMHRKMHPRWFKVGPWRFKA